MLFTLVIVIAIFWFALRDSGLEKGIIIFMWIILLILASFLWLNVSIDDEYIRVKFGYGLHRKKNKLDEIESVRVVKNHWYHGWGVRFWFWPKMWIYNVSGFDAVELKMKNWKIYRIWTDEPHMLEESISDSIK